MILEGSWKLLIQRAEYRKLRISVLLSHDGWKPEWWNKNRRKFLGKDAVKSFPQQRLARTINNCIGQTRHLVTAGAPCQQTRNCLTVTKTWSWNPDGCLTPRMTLVVGRNITLTFTEYDLKSVSRRAGTAFSIISSKWAVTVRSCPRGIA
jgi:hypothetical protein